MTELRRIVSRLSKEINSPILSFSLYTAFALMHLHTSFMTSWKWKRRTAAIMLKLKKTLHDWTGNEFVNKIKTTKRKSNAYSSICDRSIVVQFVSSIKWGSMVGTGENYIHIKKEEKRLLRARNKKYTIEFVLFFLKKKKNNLFWRCKTDMTLCYHNACTNFTEFDCASLNIVYLTSA